MTSKTIIIGLVALAFVAGSIMTGTMANAAKGGADSASLYFLKPTYAATIVYLINYEKQE